jgi:Fe-S cluster assembly ATP-binding protein
MVLKGITLSVNERKTHVIMGPNGSGKSSLALTLMGHPNYKVSSGTVAFCGKIIVSAVDERTFSSDKRARMGMFLAMQHPYEIEGVSYKDFLRQAYNAIYDGTEKQLRIKDFHTMLLKKLELLKMDEEFINRSVNVGFSGGEKKRAEILQLAVLQPKLAILDEIDSGLDVDALKIVCDGINVERENNPKMSIILITHYQRVLKYIKPDSVHVMQDGRIVSSGGGELAEELEKRGFES